MTDTDGYVLLAWWKWFQQLAFGNGTVGPQGPPGATGPAGPPGADGSGGDSDALALMMLGALDSNNDGTVTSVAVTVPGEFTVAGSPITSQGTISITKAPEAANTVWAGPTTGAAAQPTFRALVSADVPPGSLYAPPYSYQVPSTGFSITIGHNINNLILDPGGVLASGSTTMDATPADGLIVTISTTSNITSTTTHAHSGQSITDPLIGALLDANVAVSWQYVASQLTWFRIL